MFSKTKMILTGALILGSAITAQAASDRDGEDGGFVMPGSMDGVNPVHHPDWFPAQRGKATRLIDSAASPRKAGEAFGSAAPRIKTVLPAATPAKDYYGYYQSGKD